MVAPIRLAMAHRIGVPIGMASLDGAAFALPRNNVLVAEMACRRREACAGTARLSAR